MSITLPEKEKAGSNRLIIQDLLGHAVPLGSSRGKCFTLRGEKNYSIRILVMYDNFGWTGTKDVFLRRWRDGWWRDYLHHLDCGFFSLA